MLTTPQPCSQKSALFIVGPALGHVGRLYSIARQLQDMSDVKITFATPGHAKYIADIVEAEFDILRIPVLSDAAKMPACVFADGLEASMAKTLPDVIVHDMCPVRWLSAIRFPDCPRIMVTNFFLTKVAPTKTFQTIWFDRICEDIANFRSARGLKPVQSAYDLYEADQVLLADPPFLLSDHSVLPPHYKICGPCSWNMDGELPTPLAQVSDALLLSMGSTGRGAFQPAFLDEISQWADCSTTIYVGSKADDIRAQGVAKHYYNWLPLEKILAKTRLSIAQGGVGSTYLALAAGVPVITVPTHRNHEILGDLLEQAGLGICVKGEAALDKLKTADYDALHKAVQTCAKELLQFHGPKEIARHIAKAL